MFIIRAVALQVMTHSVNPFL